MRSPKPGNLPSNFILSGLRSSGGNLKLRAEFSVIVQTAISPLAREESGKTEVSSFPVFQIPLSPPTEISWLIYCDSQMFVASVPSIHREHMSGRLEVGEFDRAVRSVTPARG